MKIGLVGYGGVGKDTIAANMAHWHRVAFADGVKRVACEMLRSQGITLYVEDLINDRKLKEKWRPFLVGVGHGMRQHDPDIWVKQAILELAKRGLSREDNIFITDCRYLNEVEWVRKQGGFCIRVSRPCYTAVNDEEGKTIAEIMEKYPQMPLVVNDGSIEHLVKQVEHWIKRNK